MENICKKYSKTIFKKDYNEDIFFADMLVKENLHNCTKEIADMFSFEHIFNENSIYGHQIHHSVGMNNLDNFIYKKLCKMNK